jgi:hypothetical protein
MSSGSDACAVVAAQHGGNHHQAKLSVACAICNREPCPDTVDALWDMQQCFSGPHLSGIHHILSAELVLLLAAAAVQGSVPLPVYNAVNMMMPMNLQRVKMAAAKLKAEDKAAMLQRQLRIVAASKAEAAAAAAGGKGSKGSKGSKKAK